MAPLLRAASARDAGQDGGENMQQDGAGGLEALWSVVEGAVESAADAGVFWNPVKAATDISHGTDSKGQPQPPGVDFERPAADALQHDRLVRLLWQMARPGSNLEETAAAGGGRMGKAQKLAESTLARKKVCIPIPSTYF